MTTYNQIASNRRRTCLLVSLFIIFVLALGWIIGEASGYGEMGIIYAVVFALILNLFAYFAGDKVALATSKARRIEKNDNPYVFRIVENLCITAGLPLPKIYIVDDPSLNAFATGRNQEHASLALTTGLINALENEELEGVVAHELSHIKNRDILIATMVVVLVGIVSLLADFFLHIRYYGRDRSHGSGAITLLVLLGLILAVLSPIIAKLIQLAISRQREFLADSSGALLTRYPEGLAKALEKIAKNPQPLLSASHATAHLFFEDPFARRNKSGKLIHHLFSTHPPIEKRVRRLRNL